MKTIAIFIIFLFHSSFTRAEELQQFAGTIIGIVERSPGGDPLSNSQQSPQDFYLSQAQADQVLAYSQIHQSIATVQRPFCLATNNSQAASATPAASIAPHVGILFTSTTALPLATPVDIVSQLISHPKNWESILATQKDKLTSEQKIELISKLGTYFSNGYNYARAQDSNATGFVSTDQLLVSVKTGKPGGICRDIALAQTQMLQALGFKDSYVVTYKTYEGHHATVISIDPTTDKIIKFNYGEVTTAAKGSGTEALVQDTTLPDQGLGYKIYDTKGHSVGQLPSELGQMLSETTGLVDREFNAKNYSLGKVGFEKNGVHGNLFTGTTTTGENITGVALFLEHEDKNLKSHIGISASSVKGTRQVTSITADNLYVNMGGEIRTNPLQIGGAEVKVFAGEEMSLLKSNVSEQNRATGQTLTGKNEKDSSISGFLGLETEVKLKNGKTVIENQTYINLYPDFNHVASTDKLVPATNSIVVDTQVTQKLSDGEKSALLRSAIIFRTYGASLVAEAGLENKSTGGRYVAGVRTPLTNQPSFLPGGTTSAYARAEKELWKGITFGVELEESDSIGPSARASIEGKFD
jgi:hypothetical protein